MNKTNITQKPDKGNTLPQSGGCKVRCGRRIYVSMRKSLIDDIDKLVEERQNKGLKHGITRNGLINLIVGRYFKDLNA